MTGTSRDHLTDCLGGVTFPASKDRMLDAAVRRADPDAVQVLRALPPARYESITEVLRVTGAELS